MTGEDSESEVILFGDGSRVIVHPRRVEDGCGFVKCERSGPFVDPPIPNGSSGSFPSSGLSEAEEVNRHLNLNLGQSLFSPDDPLLLWLNRFWNSLLIAWWEKYGFRLWKVLPLGLRRRFCQTLWKIYFPIHKFLLGRRTGIHPDASYEYHALTTVLWWGRLFPNTLERIRFSLSQLNLWSRDVGSHNARTLQSRIKVIEEPLESVDPLLIPHHPQMDHFTIRGHFLFRNGPEKPTEWTIFWLYGGAFLGGDVPGNQGKADWISQHTDMDVFLCNYRLVPEFDLDDILWDICAGYKWLVQRRNPSKILVFGISSGAGAAVRLLQYIAEHDRGEQLVPSYFSTLFSSSSTPPMTIMPAGAVLVGPFVDFTEPKGSLVHYPKHDLIVNQRVTEVGFPFLQSHNPGGEECSPLHRSCRGLPPLCVVVSEHEAVYDMAVTLINRARSEGVSVTVGCWKYMCHVFPLLDLFIPEGRQAIDFMCQWMRYISSRNKANSQQNLANS